MARSLRWRQLSSKSTSQRVKPLEACQHYTDVCLTENNLLPVSNEFFRVTKCFCHLTRFPPHRSFDHLRPVRDLRTIYPSKLPFLLRRTTITIPCSSRDPLEVVGGIYSLFCDGKPLEQLGIRIQDLCAAAYHPAVC